MKKIIALLCFLTLGLVQAKEYKLLDITNDEKQDRFMLTIETDSKNNEILLMHKYTFNKQRKQTSKETINIKQLILTKKDKIVLETEGKYEVVNLKTSNFALHNGGDITVDTLYNALKSTRKEYDLELTREGDSWVIKRNGETITTMHFTSNKVPLIGTVGVSNMVTK
jgi:hypothetical protein